MTKGTFDPVEDDDFAPVGETSEPVLKLDRRKAGPPLRVYRARDGFEVAIPPAVLARMIEYGHRAAPNEWIGRVLGRLCEDARGRHVVVDGVVPDPDARTSPGSAVTTVVSELTARDIAKLVYAGSAPVGWAHGHLHCGVRFSHVDRQNQATWTQPHAIGIVVDPWSDPAIAVYRGPDSELLWLLEDETGKAACEPPMPTASPPMQPCAGEASLSAKPSLGPAQVATESLSPFTRRDLVAIAWALFFALAWTGAPLFAVSAHRSNRTQDQQLASITTRLEAVERTHASTDASVEAMPIDAGAQEDVASGLFIPTDASTDGSVSKSESSTGDAGNAASAAKTTAKPRQSRRKNHR